MGVADGGCDFGATTNRRVLELTLVKNLERRFVLILR